MFWQQLPVCRWLFACCHAGKSIVLPGNYQPEALKELSEHYDLLLHDADVSVPEQVSSLLIEASSLLETTLTNKQQVDQPYVWRLNYRGLWWVLLLQ